MLGEEYSLNLDSFQCYLTNDLEKMFKQLLSFLLLVFGCNGFINLYPKIQQKLVLGDAGSPLFLTPYIEKGNIVEAQNLAKVSHESFEDVESYAGFITVNETFNSNMFFWFFPAQLNSANAPVVLWLQGGPGATSLIGLFTENGPFYVTKKGLKKRKYSWTRNHNVIYIDNPVGTGFSFTESDAGYASNEFDVGMNLYNCLKQFFTLFPQLQKNDFYVTGESYAGKYVPAVSYTIHTNNPASDMKINLKGLAIGNGLCDPEHQLKYGDYLYQLGLIDSKGRNVFHKYEERAVDYMKHKNFIAAFDVFDELLNGDMTSGSSLFQNLTGFHYYFNYLHTDEDSTILYMGNFIQRDDVRKAIHVGSLPFNTNKVVEEHLKADVMDTIAPMLTELLSHYRCLIYNGQLDIIVAYPLTVNYLQQLKFSSAEEYLKAERKSWKVDGQIAGYSKKAGNLTEVMVRNAGHMVPTDQPKWAWDLITRFTTNKPY